MDTQSIASAAVGKESSESFILWDEGNWECGTPFCREFLQAPARKIGLCLGMGDAKMQQTGGFTP